MIALEQQLKQLVLETCQHPHKSTARQRGLTSLIRLINHSQRLWKDSSPYYEDALQLMWLYFCRNLCEALTAKSAYDSERSNVITWLNAYLKHRLQDMYIENLQQQKKSVLENRDIVETNHPINNIVSPEQPSDLLERVRQWVEIDKTKVLRQTYIRDRADVNAQVLILKRLPPETNWQILAQEFSLPISTLSSFYQRKCIPLLKELYEQQRFI
ncbi:sigma-70 family RNA polymerase sigma factor [Pseudanabaena sp. FACHB-1998]|uniref:sigma-70 family RNA polymerase sigma factor n=1 Tax=Pseudanabaena sp. FACHB-1998 TaxID=2692858 RepID=UPI001680EF5B|nr:sigma-70 family RNA polymerase sigma factor [Pseudanabaena sp. FACHB-1998]MBD2179305.1 sigma-70 family RNA polymerase sigma factor [Pseudanabaena sp. FACHB-1998]